jgi:2'-5' RNA ligase
MRCFVAVELPPELRDGIERVQKEVALPGLRLVKPEQVHLTLKFLGEVQEAKIDAVARALLSVRAAPFQARLAGLGAFPGRSIRVVWLGLQGDFGALHAQVERALVPLGFPREARDFSPHITVGRVKTPEISSLLAPKLAHLSDVDLGPFYVDRFFLKKSTLTPGGPIYENLAEFPLRAPG